MTHHRPSFDQTVMMMGACFLFLGGLTIGTAFNAKSDVVSSSDAGSSLQATRYFLPSAYAPNVRGL